MPSYRFEPLERLGLLAALTLDVLDDVVGETALDDESGPPADALYNLADAMLEWVEERRLGARPIMGHDRDALVDENLDALIRYGADGRVGSLWAKLKAKAEA